MVLSVVYLINCMDTEILIRRELLRLGIYPTFHEDANGVIQFSDTDFEIRERHIGVFLCMNKQYYGYYNAGLLLRILKSVEKSNMDIDSEYYFFHQIEEAEIEDWYY